MLLDMKKMILIVVAIIIIASTAVAVTAYTSASVEGPVSLKVTSTDQALLALKPGQDPKDIVNIESGVLEFNFGFDIYNEQSYNFYELFIVANNSAAPIEFTIKGEGIDNNYINLYEKTSSNHFIQEGTDKSYYHSLSPGEEAKIGVSFRIPGDAPSDTRVGQLKVEARPLD